MFSPPEMIMSFLRSATNEIALVHETEIAGVDPSVTQGLRGQLLLVPVAAHDGRRTDHDLSDLFRLAHRAIVTDNPDFVAEQGLARRAQATRIPCVRQDMMMRLENGRGDAFGHAVDLGKDRPHPV